MKATERIILAFIALLVAGSLIAATPIKGLIFQGNADAGGFQISNLGSPTNSSNAATLGYVTNSIATASTGSTNLTTVGTVTNGTWAGNVIGLSKGGTGATNGLASTNISDSTSAGRALLTAADDVAQGNLLPLVQPWKTSACVAAWDYRYVTLGTGTKIAAWTDLSGNGKHLTQATSGSQWNTSDRGANPDGVTNVGYTITGSLAIDYRALTVIVIYCRPASYSYSAGALMWNTNNGRVYVENGLNAANLLNPGRIGGPLGFEKVNGYAISHGTGSTVINSNRTTQTLAANSAATDTISKFFDYTGGGWAWGLPTVAALVFNRQLADWEINRIYDFYGVNQMRELVAFWKGDSITQGLYTSSDENRYATAASRYIGASELKSGVANQTLSSMISYGAVADAATSIVGRKNIAGLFLGTNDLAANGAEATLETNYALWFSQIKTANPDRLGVSFTILPRSAGFAGGQDAAGFETARATFNTWLRANYSTFSDCLVDFAANSTIGDQADASNTTYYQDGIHPQPATNTLMASIMQPVLKQLIFESTNTFASSPVTGATVFPVYTSRDAVVSLTPAGTLADLTFKLPAAAMRSGQRIVLTSTQELTALTVTSVSGSVTGSPTTLAANAFCGFQSDGTAWRRVQ